MRVGVHPGAGVWQVVAAETVFVPDGIEVLLRSSSYALCRGTAWGCCPAAEGCVLAALCARSEGHSCTCVRQACSRHVQGSRGCRGRVCAERRRDSSCSCCRADQETARLRPAHRRPLLEGLSAQKHRSASLVEEEPHPERHRSSTSRHPRSAALAGRCVPVRSCSSRWRAAHVMPSTALRYMLSSKSLKSVPGSTGDTDPLHRVASGTERGRSSHEQHSTVWK